MMLIKVDHTAQLKIKNQCTPVQTICTFKAGKYQTNSLALSTLVQMQMGNMLGKNVWAVMASIFRFIHWCTCTSILRLNFIKQLPQPWAAAVKLCSHTPSGSIGLAGLGVF